MPSILYSASNMALWKHEWMMTQYAIQRCSNKNVLWLQFVRLMRTLLRVENKKTATMLAIASPPARSPMTQSACSRSPGNELFGCLYGTGTMHSTMLRMLIRKM